MIDKYLDLFSTGESAKDVTDVLQILKNGKTSWGQVAYEVFQSSGEFVNLDRFQGVADILIAEPWNKLPDIDTLKDLVLDIVPEIDPYLSAIQNGIDIYEDIRGGSDLGEIAGSIVNWFDPLRNTPSNEI